MGLKIPNINCIYFERLGKCKVKDGTTCILIYMDNDHICNKRERHNKPIPPPPPPKIKTEKK